MADQTLGPRPITQEEAYQNQMRNYATGNAIPPPTEPQQPRYKKIYDVHISQLDHGYQVSVGCKTFAIEGTAKLISLLAAYLDNPIEIEKKLEDGKLF